MTISLLLVFALGAPLGAPEPVSLPDVKQPLVEATLKGKSFHDLALTRNLIYAKRGRPFTTPWVKAYFEAQPWYKVRADYSDTELNDIERKNLQVVRAVEAAVLPAELRVRRNTVFARHGRMFTSKDLQAHFKEQAWYKPDPKFSLARLTPRDKIEIDLIQSREASASSVEALEAWKPGRSIQSKVIANAGDGDVAQLVLRMIRELQLAGYGSACDLGELFEAPEDGDCQARMASYKRRADKLPKVDRATLRTLETRMAVLAIQLEHGEWRDCDGECDEAGKTAEPGHEKCVTACYADEEQQEKAREKMRQARMDVARKGAHERGPVLVANFLGAVLSAGA